MTELLERFLNDCRKHRRVTLIGPLLDEHAEWPDTPILFVDGGARWQSALPAAFDHPSVSVGDGDSLGNDDLDILLDPRKDCSDLEYALEILKNIDLEQMQLHGFLGGRRDHEWINLGVVARYLKTSAQTTARLGNAVSLFAPGNYQLNHHGVFSLVHFEPARTTIRGAVEYPLNEPSHFEAGSSFGLSNRASGDFSISSDVVMMCFWS